LARKSATSTSTAWATLVIETVGIKGRDAVADIVGGDDHGGTDEVGTEVNRPVLTIDRPRAISR
jgi:hypothetical protein